MTGRGDGEVTHEVKAGLLLGGGKEVVNDGLDAGAHGLDGSGGEGLVDEAAQAGVVWGVDAEHGFGEELDRGADATECVHDLVEGVEMAHARGGEAGVAGGGVDVGVAAEDPGVAEFAPVDGRVGAEAGVGGVWVGVEGGGEEVDDGGRREALLEQERAQNERAGGAGQRAAGSRR